MSFNNLTRELLSALHTYTRVHRHIHTCTLVRPDTRFTIMAAACEHSLLSPSPPSSCETPSSPAGLTLRICSCLFHLLQGSLCLALAPYPGQDSSPPHCRFARLSPRPAKTKFSLEGVGAEGAMEKGWLLHRGHSLNVRTSALAHVRLLITPVLTCPRPTHGALTETPTCALSRNPLTQFFYGYFYSPSISSYS